MLKNKSLLLLPPHHLSPPSSLPWHTQVHKKYIHTYRCVGQEEFPLPLTVLLAGLNIHSHLINMR